MLGIFFIDLETQTIPDEFSFLGIGVGVAYSYFKSGVIGFQASFISIAFAGILFLAIAKLGKFFYKKEAMGEGDIKLVMMLGSFLWLSRTIAMFYLSFLLGSVIAIVLILTKKKGRKDYIPFGPIIILATLIVLLWKTPFFTSYLFYE